MLEICQINHNNQQPKRGSLYYEPRFGYILPSILPKALTPPQSINTASTIAIIRMAALLLNIVLYPLYTPRIFSISAAIRSAFACAASRVGATEVIYTLILGSVPDGRTITLSVPSKRYCKTLDFGSVTASVSPVCVFLRTLKREVQKRIQIHTVFFINALHKGI